MLFAGISFYALHHQVPPRLSKGEETAEGYLQKWVQVLDN